jgi:Protein of unknown function (DUF669)
MSEFNFWDFSQVEPQSYDPIPEGVYKVMVVSAEETKSKTDKLMLKVKYAIIDGQYTGRNIFENMMMSGDPKSINITQQKVFSFLMASTGKTKDQIKTEKLGPESMISKSCLASVKIQPAKDGYEASNRISSFKPLPPGDETISGVPF